MATFVERMVGAAKLDVRIYEEVEADQTATGQAMAVVALSSVAAGLGHLSEGGLMGLVWGALGALIGWFLWAALVYVVGVKLLPEPQTKSSVTEIFRTVGFAVSPGVLYILAAIPLIGLLINFAVFIWVLVAVFIAVRQALDYQSTFRAVAVAAIGWVAYVFVARILFSLVA